MKFDACNVSFSPQDSAIKENQVTYTDFYWHFINIIIIYYYGWTSSTETKTCVKLNRHWARNTLRMNEASHNAWMNLPEHWRQRRQSKRHSSLQRWEDMIAYQEKHSFLLLLKNFSLASSYTCLKHFVDKNFYQISQFNSLKWLNKGSLHTSIFYRKSYTTPKHNTFHSHTCQSCQFPQIILI